MTGEPTAGVQGLFAAVYGGAEDTVVQLLRAGVPAEATDEDGQSALYLAAVSDEAGVARLLLAAGADPDRASGEDSADLPLCGAACGGHTEVVRALLAGGAQPDRREAFGFTAVAWAVVQGFTDTLEALLEHGADPDLPGPGGERPLVLAARRGSPAAVRALLRHGAGLHDEGAREAALAEALRWSALDVEHELRAGLRRAYGDGYGTVVRRVVADGSQSVVVELVRDDGTPVAGQEQQTGHAAVATVLEAELAVATPYEELALRALRCGDPERDDWLESVAALWRRGDEETFQAVAAWCASDDPLRRAFAADALGRLGSAPAHGMEDANGDAGTGPFTARATALLGELSRTAEGPEPARGAVAALGRCGDPSALPEILRHAGHPDAGVRRAVALSLREVLAGAQGVDGATVRALVALSGDAWASVRGRAVPALAGVPADAVEIREALAGRLDDPDAGTAAWAAYGLAVRQDARAVDALARILAEEDPAGHARATALDAVRHVLDGQDRIRLESTLPRRTRT